VRTGRKTAGAVAPLVASAVTLEKEAAMSTIVVIGVTGYAGGHITSELLDRGHTVVGVARDTSRVTPRERLDVRSGSLYDPVFLAGTVQGPGAVVVAVRAHNNDAPDLETVVPALLDAAAAAGAPPGIVGGARRPLVAAAGARLGIVGGAGSLLVAEGGPRVLDSNFPEEYRPEADAHCRVLEALKQADTTVDWFYLSPAGSFGSYNPGKKTGTYRLGDDLLITDADGHSNISGADFALAFADEIEKPAHHKARFTLGY
jgi:putative NADH-flavin reductase